MVAILACLVAVLFTRDRRRAARGTAAIAAIWAGLYFSYSQSSFAALVAGVLLAAIFAWGRRGLASSPWPPSSSPSERSPSPNVRHDVFGNGRGLNSATERPRQARAHGIRSP